MPADLTRPHSATVGSSDGSRTITLTESNTNDEPQSTSATIRLKKKDSKKVAWREDTVDNENMNKKSSKCCCVYRKPHQYDESSSDSEEEDCDHCRGHKEKKYKPKRCDGSHGSQAT